MGKESEQVRAYQHGKSGPDGSLPTPLHSTRIQSKPLGEGRGEEVCRGGGGKGAYEGGGGRSTDPGWGMERAAAREGGRGDGWVERSSGGTRGDGSCGGWEEHVVEGRRGEGCGGWWHWREEESEVGKKAAAGQIEKLCYEIFF